MKSKKNKKNNFTREEVILIFTLALEHSDAIIDYLNNENSVYFVEDFLNMGEDDLKNIRE